MTMQQSRCRDITLGERFLVASENRLYSQGIKSGRLTLD
jgi:hypothetical protein